MHDDQNITVVTEHAVALQEIGSDGPADGIAEAAKALHNTESPVASAASIPKCPGISPQMAVSQASARNSGPAHCEGEPVSMPSTVPV